jgi:NAD(P)-dependent dehydrogenase (short-subunit alcohol dehydrogenase family)
MTMTHQGKVAIVTGAAQGIGRAIAVTLAQRGAALVLVDLVSPDETASMCGPDVLSIVGDVADDESWKAIAQRCDDRHGKVDILVNNAGIYPIAELDQLTTELWRKTFAINVESLYHSARHIVPLMRRNRWGRIVNIGSNAIGYAFKGGSHYMASKMAVIGFTRGLANDVGEDGITVNVVLAPPTKTPGTAGTPDEMFAMLTQSQAIKRVAEPEDTAGPVAFLTSDDARFVTGQAIVADGGTYKIS